MPLRQRIDRLGALDIHVPGGICYDNDCIVRDYDGGFILPVTDIGIGGTIEMHMAR